MNLTIPRFIILFGKKLYLFVAIFCTKRYKKGTKKKFKVNFAFEKVS